MVWLKLFRSTSLERGMRKGKEKIRPIKDGVKIFRHPKYDLHDRLKVRWVFNICKIPYYFRKQDILQNPNTPIHKLPKGILNKEKEKITRLVQLRESLSQAIEKTEKYRQERFNKKKLTGLDLQMSQAQVFLAGKNVSSITEILTENDIMERMLKSENRMDNKRNESIHVKGVKPLFDSHRFHKERTRYMTDLGIFDQPSINNNTKEVKKEKEKSEMMMTKKEYKQMKKDSVATSSSSSNLNTVVESTGTVNKKI